MYPVEITNQFIELRSRDISLERIAQQLGINKSTAIDWQRRYQAQIDEFKAIHLDAIRERLTTRYEDELEYAMTEIKRIRAELKTRDWDYEATTFLHYAEAAAYRRVQKLCALADFPRADRAAIPLASDNAQTSDLNGSSSARVETQNPTKTQPFPHQKERGNPSAPLDPNVTPASDAEPFIESTVVSPNECMRSVLEKCLQAQSAI